MKHIPKGHLKKNDFEVVFTILLKPILKKKAKKISYLPEPVWENEKQPIKYRILTDNPY